MIEVMVQEGMVTGVPEESSVYDREFVLCPPIANYTIACHFPQSMLPKVRQAMQRNVTVRGSMHYYADQPFPKLVKVTSLEIHPRDDEGIARCSIRSSPTSWTVSILCVIAESPCDTKGAQWHYNLCGSAA